METTAVIYRNHDIVSYMNSYPTRKRVIQLSVFGAVSFVALPILFLLAMPIISTISKLPEGSSQLGFIAILVAALPSLALNLAAIIAAVMHLRNPKLTTPDRKLPIVIGSICTLMWAFSLYQVLG